MKSITNRFLACAIMLALSAVCTVSQTDERLTPPPPSSCTSPVLYCNGTSPIRQSNVLISSLGLDATQLSILTTMLGTTNTNNSHITGVVVSVAAGCASNCTPGTYLDAGSTHNGVYCPSLDFSGLNTFISDVYGANTTNRKLTNIVVAPAGYNSNNETSLGVFSQGWANTLADCSGNPLYPLAWAQGIYYLPGDYIKDSGGKYWQIENGAANVNFTPTNASYTGTTATITVRQTPPSSLIGQSITVTLATPSSATAYNVVETKVTNVIGNQIYYTLNPNPGWSGAVTAGDITGDARCVAGASGGPGPTTQSPYTDGLTATACTWTKLTGTSAPPQDAWVSSSYLGLKNQAYQLNLNPSAIQTCTGGANGTCRVTLASPYIGSVGDSVTVSTGGTNLDCTNCAISAGGIGTNTVTYSNPNKNYSTTATGTLSAQRVFNINSVNGTISGSPNPVLATGLPTAYEPPMKAWIKYVCSQVYAHYASDTRVGYIRCGLTEGGEADTVGLMSNTGPGWPFGSQSVFVSYYQDVMGEVGMWAKNNSLVCMGNLNSFDLPEGQISISNNCGIGTNGYKVDDVVALSPNFSGSNECLVIKDIQSDWCWNFNQYYSKTMPNGNYPILELQTSLASTPTTDVLGKTGGLASDSNTNDCGSYCPWPGLLPVARTPVSGSSLTTNDGEWYMCDFMIAYDSNYTNDYSHFKCTKAFSSYATPYQGAFGAFAP
jgi:hypothetical protein